MSNVLKLYNTFTRTLNNVKLGGKLIAAANYVPGSNLVGTQTINGSLYICGPTVYSDCHVGHALTYIRADLFRRFMKSIFNVQLHTVMNITDIDDKILEKTRELYPAPSNLPNDAEQLAEPNRHPFNKVSDEYYAAFLRDMKSINVLPADMYVRISKHVHLIIQFIRKLERDGHAYIADNGDVYFRVESVKNYVGTVDRRNLDGADNSLKNDSRDFVLWKAAKPNEPVWNYRSSLSENRIIPGRPGWHVQCSAISSAIFGNELNFHFGGKDLIYPHHYNEEACCCAFHQLNTSKSLHVWSNNWLHSGHLVLKDSKMSKSLGNVIAINSFIGRSSVNALRLLCISTHYRSDIQFNEDLFDKLKALDHKINSFNSYLLEELRTRQKSLSDVIYEEPDCGTDMEEAIMCTRQTILEGICDDFHLDKGLDSILQLSKIVYSKNLEQVKSLDLIVIWSMLKEWLGTCGLTYGETGDTNCSTPVSDENLLKLILDFRETVRIWTLNEMQRCASGPKNELDMLLKECDKVRSDLNQIGFVARDGKK